jgi:hypothetical protein
MKPVHIDFCRQGNAGRSRSGLWLLLLAGIVLVVAGGSVGSLFAKKAEARSAQASQLLDERVSLNDAVRQQEKVPVDMVDSINGAIHMLDYPNMELLTQLEHHVRQDVLVVSVEMGAVRTNLRIVVQAAAAQQVLDYLDALKREPGFKNLALTRQEAASGADAQGLWRFTLEMPQAEATPASARSSGGREG